MYLCTDYHFNKFKNNTKMKKVQTLMLMLLVAVMGMTVQSCGSDEKTEIKPITVNVYYKYTNVENLNFVSGQEAKAAAFIAELKAVLADITSREVTDELVIAKTQAVVEKYNNDVISGTFELQTSNNPTSGFKTIKSFTLALNPKYLE